MVAGVELGVGFERPSAVGANGHLAERLIVEIEKHARSGIALSADRQFAGIWPCVVIFDILEDDRPRFCAWLLGAARGGLFRFRGGLCRGHLGRRSGLFFCSLGWLLGDRRPFADRDVHRLLRGQRTRCRQAKWPSKSENGRRQVKRLVEHDASKLRPYRPLVSATTLPLLSTCEWSNREWRGRR